ncbi:MAG: T9SS type A sorting domain-containing protein [Saprospiraceae bacterium]|nr:T9SS type A sorting domain-containing protein [Saprospiraceae bacterium]
MKHTNLRFYLLFAALFLLVSLSKARAQCNLTVSSQINVSLPSSCNMQVQPEMALEEAPDCSVDNLAVEILQGGVWVNAHLNATHIGQLLNARVVDLLTLSSVPFLIQVEDNAPPVLSNCNNVVTINCEDACSPSLLPTISDCSAVTLSSSDISIVQPCGSPYSAYVARTYTVTDAYNNSSSCTRTIRYLRREGMVVFPSNITLQVSGSNCAPWCGNGAGQPNPTPLSAGSGQFGAPTIDGSPIFAGVKTPETCIIPCVSNMCQQTASYTDVVVNLCGSNKRIDRTWKIVSPCNGITTYTQKINLYTDGNTNCGTACNTPTGLNQFFNFFTHQTMFNWSLPASTCIVRYDIRYRVRIGGVWQPWVTASTTAPFYMAVLPQGVQVNWQVRTQCYGVHSGYTPTRSFTSGNWLAGRAAERDEAAPEVPEVTHLEPESNQNLLSVFPNPGYDAVTVSLNAPTAGETTLMVTDWQGRIVYQSPLSVGTLSLDLQLGNQPAGAYLVRLIQSDGKSAVETFVRLK